MESLTARRRSVRVPPVAFGVLVIAVFVATIALGAASGLWSTTGRTTAGGGRVAPQGQSATEVKGWMAIGDVAAAWGVPLADVLSAFGMPSDTAPTTALKDLESDSFSVAALRAWLAARQGSE